MKPSSLVTEVFRKLISVGLNGMTDTEKAGLKEIIKSKNFQPSIWSEYFTGIATEMLSADEAENKTFAESFAEVIAELENNKKPAGSPTPKRAISRVRKAIENFQAVQSKYRHFGAGDTEPDAVFQLNLKMAICGQNPQPKLYSAEAWQLFTASMDCTEAAKALNAAAQEAVDVIKAIPECSRKNVEAYLRDFCWRIDWC